MCKCCSGSKHASKYKKFEFLTNHTDGHDYDHHHEHEHHHHGQQVDSAAAHDHVHGKGQDALKD